MEGDLLDLLEVASSLEQDLNCSVSRACDESLNISTRNLALPVREETELRALLYTSTNVAVHEGEHDRNLLTQESKPGLTSECSTSAATSERIYVDRVVEILVPVEKVCIWINCQVATRQDMF